MLLPDELWRRAKQIALDEDTSLKQLLIEGLEMRLRRGSVSAKGVTVNSGTHRTEKGPQ